MGQITKRGPVVSLPESFLKVNFISRILAIAAINDFSKTVFLG